jgi:hypothetical protein
MLFRPDDSRPLDLVERDEWFDMQSMGRSRYVLRRTASVLANTLGPVAIPVWCMWWFAPESRQFIFHRFTWIALATGIVIVGFLGAAHAFDTWRSYEKRSTLEDAPPQSIASLYRRGARLGLIAATLSTIVIALEIVVHAPPWIIATMGAASLVAWRSVYITWRSRNSFPIK